MCQKAVSINEKSPFASAGALNHEYFTSRFIDETNNGHPPSGYNWLLHDTVWTFDFDYTYYTVPEYKWYNWQVWMTIEQEYIFIVNGRKIIGYDHRDD